jgi:hypothetical protein
MGLGFCSAISNVGLASARMPETRAAIITYLKGLN